MKTEIEVKRMFNVALIQHKIIMEEWKENGNNHFGTWFNANHNDITDVVSTLNTLRRVLDYYSNEPFKL